MSSVICEHRRLRSVPSLSSIKMVWYRRMYWSTAKALLILCRFPDWYGHLRGTDSISGETTLSCSLLKRYLLWKGSNFFFPFVLDHFSEGGWCMVTKVFPSSKKMENLPRVSLHLRMPNHLFVWWCSYLSIDKQKTVHNMAFSQTSRILYLS